MPYHVLVTDQVDPEGVALLTAEPDLIVHEVATLPPAELLQRIGQYDAIIGRSATRISAELLSAATRLRVVGRAGVGVDNIALDVATRLGVAVINAPAGNTVAVAELFFGVVLGILRQLPAADASMRAGRWDRSTLMGTELRGKTLGVVGLGRIGGEVAQRALAFGMNVVAYDPYVSDARFQSLRVQRYTSLDALLQDTNVLTVHVPLTGETRRMIGAREVALLPRGAVAVNMARGGVIDELALVDALQSGHLRAAALDAFEAEPLAPDSPLRSVPSLYLTPHMGASTLEAQRNVSVDACRAVRDALLNGEFSASLNITDVGAGAWQKSRHALALTRKMAAIARGLLAAHGIAAPARIEVRCGNAHVGARGALLASAAMGVLEAIIEQERLNVINARAVAEARGIELAFTELAADDQEHTVEVYVSGAASAGPDGAQGVHSAVLHQSSQDTTAMVNVAGRVLPNGLPRVTQIGGFHVDVHPRETLLILTNNDVPGVIGRVGTLLGERGANIAEYHQARLAQGGEALAAVSLDAPLSPDTREALLALPEIRSATILTFPRQ